MSVITALWHLLARSYALAMQRQYHPLHDGFTHYSLRAQRHDAALRRALEG